jgi:glyoxylate utilization-related uncharacterized protein
MSEEIEYLTEEELAQAHQVSVMSNDYLVYFDKTTGAIICITNEERTNLDSFIKMPYDDVKPFLEGKQNFNNFKIVLDKNELIMINVNEEMRTDINFNSLQIVPDATADFSLIVENHLDTKHWAFVVRPDVVRKLEKQQLDVTLDFYLYMHQNKNFHIRTISVTLAQLLSDKKYFIPHLHAAEGKKDNVKILTKRFFDTYGIRTLNESKT